MTEPGGPRTAGDAKRAWPGILDVNELQGGRNPAWWRKAFPGKDPARLLEAGERDGWGWFWNTVFPRGFVIAEKVRGGWKWELPGQSLSPCDIWDWKGVEEAALREFVSGRLTDTDPSAAGTFSGRLYLYWEVK